MNATQRMRWSPAMRAALRRHVRHALERLDPDRYAQEPAYVAALLARLDGVVYKGRGGRLEIRSTIVADRGPKSAESEWGADFGIVAVLDDRSRRIEKGVLGQAKKGPLGSLNDFSRQFLQGQCEKMSQATNASLTLEVPTRCTESAIVREIAIPPRTPDSLLQDRLRRLPLEVGRPQELADYLTDRFMTCLHGDRSPRFVRGISESKLLHLRLLGELAS